MEKEQTVLIRIRRMGNQFSTCGIGIAPPPKYRGVPGIKQRCPKLVPGQVVRVPVSHHLVAQTNHIEIVRRVEPDEILRPIVFDNVADAFRANPSNRQLKLEDYQNGMALAGSAIAKAKEEFNERSENDYPLDLEPLEPLYEEVREVNKVARGFKDDIRPVADEEEENEPKPRRRRRA